MAEQKYKSQADKAAAGKKSKARSSKQTPKKDTQKSKVSVTSVPKDKKEHNVPVRVISSVLFLGLFILFLIIFLITRIEFLFESKVNY